MDDRIKQLQKENEESKVKYNDQDREIGNLQKENEELKIQINLLEEQFKGVFPLITIDKSAKEDFKKLMNWTEKEFNEKTTNLLKSKIEK